LAWKIPATLIANTATGALALAAVSGNTSVKLFMVAGAAATVAFGGMAVGETLRKLPQKTNDPGFQPA
ncbi:MAG: hypothetical protein PHE27_04290, partial [Alphaproteobacteria bacterium]|nr:hypothetical protein [Alphaproteobacteria bacterium]